MAHGVLPVLWITLCFHTVDSMVRHVYIFPSGESITAKTTTSIPTECCSTIKLSKYTLWVAQQRGQSLPSTNAF